MPYPTPVLQHIFVTSPPAPSPSRFYENWKPRCHCEWKKPNNKIHINVHVQILHSRPFRTYPIIQLNPNPSYHPRPDPVWVRILHFRCYVDSTRGPPLWFLFFLIHSFRNISLSVFFTRCTMCLCCVDYAAGEKKLWFFSLDFRAVIF